MEDNTLLAKPAKVLKTRCHSSQEQCRGKIGSLKPLKILSLGLSGHHFVKILRHPMIFHHEERTMALPYEYCKVRQNVTQFNSVQISQKKRNLVTLSLKVTFQPLAV